MTKTLSLLGVCVALAGTGGYCASRALIHDNPVTAAAPHELNSYRDIVKRVLPAVVSIEVKSKARVTKTGASAQSPMPFDFPGLPDEMRKEFDRFRKQPPSPDSSPGRHAFGSGFIVDPTGIIVTNDHVVRGAEEVEVLLQDGRKFIARNIKRDPRTDLAVLRIDAKEALPFLKLGDSDAMEIGDRVLAIGAPLGMTGTVTSGIVSAKGRDIHMNMYEDFLQTDAAINPGNSGGPLVNLDGEVVGINSAIKSDSGGFQGIGLAISSNMAKNVLSQLQKTGSVVRGYLGVQAMRLDPEVATRLGVASKTGVVIAKVMNGSPAAKAGLQDGDVLTEIAGKTVRDPRTLQHIVANLPVGKQVELKIFRDGAPKTLPLTVVTQPQEFGLDADNPRQTESPTATELGKLGVQVSDLTPKTAAQFGYADKTEGVLIASVDPDSAAATAGLKSGMLILKVDNHAVKTASELQPLLAKSNAEKGWLLQVRMPQGGTSYVLLKAASR